MTQAERYGQGGGGAAVIGIIEGTGVVVNPGTFCPGEVVFATRVDAGKHPLDPGHQVVKRGTTPCDMK